MSDDYLIQDCKELIWEAFDDEENLIARDPSYEYVRRKVSEYCKKYDIAIKKTIIREYEGE